LERFVNKPDYEQTSILKDLQITDVLCSRTTWINLGRDPAMADLRDTKVNEIFFHGRCAHLSLC
jgi:hypothetical protein